MASSSSVSVFAILLLSAGPIAYADTIDSDPTITVIEEGEGPDDIVKAISVPDHRTASASTGNGSEAPTTSAEARNFGHQVSQDARERARTDVRTDNPARTRHGAN